jgi:glycosyltransferase involved in cell wall biosynthesis
MLDQITPVILTFNEEVNIARVLDRLSWAKSIVIVDSFSSDRTLELAARYPAVQIVQRRFDSHAQQWNFAIHKTKIQTAWILALDADYVLSQEVVDELAGLQPAADPDVSGFKALFTYCVFGKPLHGTLYPPVTLLFQSDGAQYIQDGHTQRLVLSGKTETLKGRIYHDDRKKLSAWLQAQDRYMALEADVLHQKPFSSLCLADRLRKLIIVAPVVVFFYCLLIKKGIMDGRAGLYYAVQRSLTEAILSLHLIHRGMQK